MRCARGQRSDPLPPPSSPTRTPLSPPAPAPFMTPWSLYPLPPFILSDGFVSCSSLAFHLSGTEEIGKGFEFPGTIGFRSYQYGLIYAKHSEEQFVLRETVAAVGESH
ncbi:uncharacterized protein LOC141835490 [Curcuma longa]|uniref:uncharacterized protein LOC141835490 n=1 Tax=Curcuma longa TaxID=136217 RepID=UPI003D9DB42B